MNKLINIYSDISRRDCLSYFETIEAIKNNEQLIETCCLDFFSSEYIDLGYEVILHKIKDGKAIIMSELFDEKTCKRYTQRVIRKAHILRKLVLSGSIQFVEFHDYCGECGNYICFCPKCKNCSTNLLSYNECECL